MSSLFKASLLLAVFFGINKIFALVRQALIAWQFGFSAEIDAFNVANNLPDMLFSLFSGGALALAFIPVFAEYLHLKGRESAWKLFSKIANILFVVTLFFALLFAFFADPIVASRFGVSPGFSFSQQVLVVDLMRINLIAMVIFSLSGLVMATLQAHKSFLLPAIAPIFYNIGLIIGAVILAPADGMKIGTFTLPAFNLGVYGLVYGTVFGALCHLLVQIPGIIKHQFVYILRFGIKDPDVQKVFKLMTPRIATVFLIQLTFLARDNIASYLTQGSVTALTYGYFILQVPETLIGTAIATALLPTLSELVTKNRHQEFAQSIKRAFQVLIASTVITALIIGLLLPQLIDVFFDFDPKHADLLVWVTRAYLFGLLGHALLEVVVRAFYAKQNALTPLKATAIRVVLFLVLSITLVGSTGAVGLAFFDSLTIMIEVAILCFLLYKIYPAVFALSSTIYRTLFGSLLSAVLILLILFLPLPPLITLAVALFSVSIVYLLFIREEIKVLIRL